MLTHPGHAAPGRGRGRGAGRCPATRRLASGEHVALGHQVARRRRRSARSWRTRRAGTRSRPSRIQIWAPLTSLTERRQHAGSSSRTSPTSAQRVGVARQHPVVAHDEQHGDEQRDAERRPDRAGVGRVGAGRRGRPAGACGPRPGRAGGSSTSPRPLSSATHGQQQRVGVAARTSGRPGARPTPTSAAPTAKRHQRGPSDRPSREARPMRCGDHRDRDGEREQRQLGAAPRRAAATGRRGGGRGGGHGQLAVAALRRAGASARGGDVGRRAVGRRLVGAVAARRSRRAAGSGRSASARVGVVARCAVGLGVGASRHSGSCWSRRRGDDRRGVAAASSAAMPSPTRAAGQLRSGRRGAGRSLRRRW